MPESSPTEHLPSIALPFPASPDWALPFPVLHTSLWLSSLIVALCSQSALPSALLFLTSSFPIPVSC